MKPRTLFRVIALSAISVTAPLQAKDAPFNGLINAALHASIRSYGLPHADGHKPGKGDGEGHEKDRGEGHEIGHGHGHDDDHPASP